MSTDKVSYDVIAVIEKLESTYDMTNITLFILPKKGEQDYKIALLW